MITRNSPFDRMTDAFALNAEQGATWARAFIPMSAGVNWTKPSRAVRQLLSLELENGVGVRNYGNPGGAPPIAALLELPERNLHGVRDLRVTITHGTTEGAYLLLSHWQRVGLMPKGSTLLGIGHQYGLYDRLADDFGIRFRQVLGWPGDRDTFMPCLEKIAAALADEKPAVVIIILPNNPLGEIISSEALQEICRHASNTGARILVDRVCMMPWDDYASTGRLIGPLVSSGQAAIIDSLSKSESLAGVRVGFAITDSATKDGLVELIKSRYLNPPAFPTATMAALRLAQFDLKTGRRLGAFVEKAVDQIFSEYPGDEDFREFVATAINVMPELLAGTQKRRDRMRMNFGALEDTFSHRLARPLIWQAGFNVALSTVDMENAFEISDTRELARESGVGVLTTNCFCRSDQSQHYFIRVGLTLHQADFAQGLDRLESFYANRHRSHAQNARRVEASTC